MNTQKKPSIQNIKQKLIQSAHTATTSSCFIKKKLSLTSCHSSISINEKHVKEEFLCQRKLFMKFLTTLNNPKNNAKVLEQMKKLYQRNFSFQKQVQIFGVSTPKISFAFSHCTISDLEAINYFCSIWLMHMGYKSEKNKNAVMDRVKIDIPISQLHKAVSFYQLFGDSKMKETVRWELICKTCLNGWEFFNERLLEYCKNTQ